VHLAVFLEEPLAIELILVLVAEGEEIPVSSEDLRHSCLVPSLDCWNSASAAPSADGYVLWST